MQCVQCRNDIPQVYSVNIASKEAVHDHNFSRGGMLAELVRRPQHIRGFQWRAHGGEGVRHIVAQPARRNPAPSHVDLL
jgi:hypothetical protein